MKTILHISWLLLRVIKSTNTSFPLIKTPLPLSMHFDSLFAITDSAKASLFNNYFYSIFTRSSFVLPTTDELPSVDSLISDVSVSDSDVYSELTKLDTSKAMGIDNIGPKILKFCAPALYLPIHHLFSLSVSSVPTSRMVYPLHSSCL